MSSITITDRQTARNKRRIERERLAFAASCNDGMDSVSRGVAFLVAHRWDMLAGCVVGFTLFGIGVAFGLI
jgi:hypothetical protein